MPGFVEWMLGYPDGWTEGVSRTQRLRILGNSVQVQVAELIGFYLWDTMTQAAPDGREAVTTRKGALASNG